jgi:hypothetical protein
MGFEILPAREVGRERRRERGSEGGGEKAYLNDAGGIDVGSSGNTALSPCSEGAKEEGLTPGEDAEEGVAVDVALAFTLRGGREGGREGGIG